jgi:hypothetical protein
MNELTAHVRDATKVAQDINSSAHKIHPCYFLYSLHSFLNCLL